MLVTFHFKSSGQHKNILIDSIIPEISSKNLASVKNDKYQVWTRCLASIRPFFFWFLGGLCQRWIMAVVLENIATQCTVWTVVATMNTVVQVALIEWTLYNFFALIWRTLHYCAQFEWTLYNCAEIGRMQSQSRIDNWVWPPQRRGDIAVTDSHFQTHRFSISEVFLLSLWTQGKVECEKGF